MRNSLKKSILTKYLLAFFVVLALFSPLSFSFDTTMLIKSTAYAVGETAIQAAAKVTGSGIVDAVSKWIGTAFLGIASAFTWMGGKLFDTAFISLVLEMGKWINTESLGGAIDNAWKIIRDICNLAFIFGFIYIGIRTILDPENSSTKRMLAQVIIGALLINFSLFFTKIVIDFSNFTAIQIYNAMTTGSGSLSASMANALGIITFYGTPAPDALDKMTGNLWFFIMAGVFLLTAAFVFIAGAVLLIIRFVALVLIMVASPVLFAGAVFPGTQGIASDLWKKLISYSFFAPIYLLMILISLLILSKIPLAGTGDSFIQAFTLGGDSFAIFLKFFIAIFFLISSLTIASKLGIQGGNMAINIGNNLRGKAQSFIGRKTVGWASAKALKGYEKLDANASKASGWRGAGLKTIRGGINMMTMGDRNTRGVLEAGKKANFGGEYSYKDDTEYNKERKVRQASIYALNDFKKTVGSNIDKDGILKKFDVNNPTQVKEQIKLERAVADASVKDLEEITHDQRKALVGIMTQSQIDGLTKSEKITDTEKSELAQARKEQFKTLYAENRDKLSKANTDNLEALGEEYLSDNENALQLTSSQMDDLKKKLTPTEFKRLSDEREKHLLELADGKTVKTKIKGVDAYLNQNHILKQKPGEIAKMPAKVLIRLSKSPATQLPLSTLSKISQEGTLSHDDQKEIRRNLDAYADGGHPDSDDYKKWLNDTPLGKQFGK